MFSQAISPAVKSHLEAQLSFLADMSNKLCGAVQRITDLNLEYAQSCTEDMANSSRQLLSVKDPTELTSVMANQLQAASERWRGYEQRLFNLLANTQLDLSKTAESHVPETSRTAAAVADEIVRKASEETEKASQVQRSVAEKMARGTNGAGQQSGQPPQAAR